MGSKFKIDVEAERKALVSALKKSLKRFSDAWVECLDVVETYKREMAWREERKAFGVAMTRLRSIEHKRAKRLNKKSKE